MVEVKCKKSVKIIIGLIISCAIILALSLIGKNISDNKKIDSEIEVIEKEIDELKEKKSNTSSMFEQAQIDQEIMRLDSEITSLEFDKKTNYPFIIVPILMITIVSCTIVYNIGNREQIMARQKQMHQERFEMFGKAIANAAKEINPEYKVFTCPNCGANIDGDEDIETCTFCGTKLTKVGKFH